MADTSTLTRPTHLPEASAALGAPGSQVSTAAATATRKRPVSATTSRGRAGVAFVSGLVGLLVANLLLGPVAIGLGISALRRGEARRGRAALAIALGVADLVVYAVLAVHAAAGHGGVIWHFGSF